MAEKQVCRVNEKNKLKHTHPRANHKKEKRIKGAHLKFTNEPLSILLAAQRSSREKPSLTAANILHKRLSDLKIKENQGETYAYRVIRISRSKLRMG